MISHSTESHPDLDIKYRRRELRYRTKCLIGYKPAQLTEEGKVLHILDKKHETLTVNQTVVNVSTPIKNKWKYLPAQQLPFIP